MLLDGSYSWEAKADLVAGRRRPSKPLVFRSNGGRRTPEDFGYGGSPALLLVSNAFTDALGAARCTGWDSIPVSLETVGGKPLGHQRLLLVTGVSGPLMHGTTPTDPTRPRWAIGSTFDPESWDGSDLFLPGPSLGAVFSQRARDALVAAKLKGMRFSPLDQVQNYVRN